MESHQWRIYHDARIAVWLSRRSNRPKYRYTIHVRAIASYLPGYDFRSDIHIPLICRRVPGINFWTGSDTVLAAGKQVVVRAPLDTMPIFVRAGSILPMDPKSPMPIRRLIRLNCGYIPAPMVPLISMRMKATITVMKKAFTPLFLLSGTKPLRPLLSGNRSGSFPGMLNKRTFKDSLGCAW